MSSIRQIVWRICSFFMSLFFGLASYVQASNTLNRDTPPFGDLTEANNVAVDDLFTGSDLLDCIAVVYIHFIVSTD